MEMEEKKKETKARGEEASGIADVLLKITIELISKIGG